MIDWLLLLVLLFTISFAFYKWATANDKYFQKRNVKYVEPTFLIGNTGDLFFNRCSAVAYTQKIYNEFPDEP